VVNKAAGFGFPPERTVVFPWGVDLDQFTPGKGDLREELGWQDQFVLLSVRSWEPLYGVDVLARAFTQAAQRLPHLRLMLLSGGSQEALIRRIFREGGVESQVYFGGHIPNDRLRDFYRSTDLYLSASHSDGSSVSLMEALACGCPAMVSDIPGNREWITPGEQGWLFPDGDADALAAQIGQAVESRDSLPEMKVAARRLAERRADWNKNFQILLSAYQTAVEAEIND
jgi:glycosyltransferase involved in cell wall biosynthesis